MLNQMRRIVSRAVVPGSLLALLVACQTEPPADQPESARPVRVATVEAAPAEVELRLPGSVRPVQRQQPAFLQAGYLAERPVQRGQQVAPGDLLARLDNPSLEPAVAMAEARLAELEERLAQAERELQRAERLRESGAVSTDELDRLASQRTSLAQARDQAQASLIETQNQREQASLRAPFAARVTTIHAEPGDFLAAGQPVLELAGLDAGLEVALSLPGHVAAKLQLGQSVDVSATRQGLNTQGRLVEIGQAGPGGLAPALVALDDAATGFFSGQPVQLFLRYQQDLPSGSLLVPLSALSSAGNQQVRVFRLDNGRVELVSVSPGRVKAGLVELSVNGSAELAVGDQVVVAGQFNLADGHAVRVLP